MYHKLRSYDIWFWNIRCDRQKLLSFWVIFCPFSPLTTQKIIKDITILHICTINGNHDVRFPRYGVQQTEFFVILECFLSFYPSTDPENQTFEKIKKKKPEDIIILDKSNINENHMMYGSWDMKCDWQIFLSFWTVFCHFPPLTTRKIKILKNWKIHLDISSFYTSVPNVMIICYTVP